MASPDKMGVGGRGKGVLAGGSAAWILPHSLWATGP